MGRSRGWQKVRNAFFGWTFFPDCSVEVGLLWKWNALRVAYVTGDFQKQRNPDVDRESQGPDYAHDCDYDCYVLLSLSLSPKSLGFLLAVTSDSKEHQTRSLR